MFKTIVVAVDGSDPSKRAIATACMLARDHAGELHLVHTPEIDVTSYAVGAAGMSVDPRPDQVAEAGKAVMDAAIAAATQQGCVVTRHLISSDGPAEAVVRYATTHGADLIVAGRRGMGSLSSLVLGSTSQQISHDATCAVLTVK